MERFIYLVILAIFVLIFKAFFLDDYLKKRALENTESVSVEQTEATVEENSTVTPKKVHTPNKHEGMPIDALGDSIAEKLEKRF